LVISIKYKTQDIMMSKIFLLILFILKFSLILGCAGKSNVTLTAVDPGSQVTAAKAVKYVSFREAMQNVDLTYLRTEELSDQQKSFAEALRLIIMGNDLEAEQLLRIVRVAETDSLLQNDAENILSTMLFYQSSWAALLQLDSLPTTPEEEDNMLLPKAYSKALPEEYKFLSTSSHLPTTFTASGVPTIEVEVNGIQKKFLLDTGAGMSVVSDKLAKECRILPLIDQRAEAGTSTSRKVGIQPAVIENLKIGNLSIKNHPVIIIEQKDLQFKLLGLFTVMKIEGIIGWNAIQNLFLEIDYRNKITAIQKPEKFDVPNRNFFLLGGYPIVRLRSEEGIPLNFGLDTGARESWITANLLKKINYSHTTSSTKKIGSAGGWEKVDSKVLPELSLFLNEYQLTFKNIGTRPARLDEFVELDGVLGSDVFENGKIRIDYRNGIFDLVMPDFPLKR
jgi:gag-polyprotein putative aspartyl protease